MKFFQMTLHWIALRKRKINSHHTEVSILEIEGVSAKRISCQKCLEIEKWHQDNT